jgi:hypothetical protein
MFSATSRYAKLEPVKIQLPDGRVIVYIPRRFLPDPASMTIIAEHVLTQGERLDNITARYLADPEQFWRLCDANPVLRPDELTARIGRRLRIPLPQPG